MTTRIGVVGAGMMGSEIALIFALAGNDVLLTDQNVEAARAAIGRLEGVLDRGIGRGLFSEADKGRALGHLRAAESLEAFADRELVVEAVFEDQEIKQAVFRRLDGILGAEAIIASNTSTIPISTLASAVSAGRQTRFLGTHFFSPVHRMKLVEVIPGFDTTDEVITQVMDLCREAGKEPIRVKDVPGFAVNRVLHAFLIEAVKLVEEGVATPEDIDKACRLGLGHPMGPFELMDVVTNSLSLQAQEIMHDAYGERFRPASLLKQKVAAGHVGRKAGRGWKIYSPTR
ncbi:3-hydroxyacyl-CoA dehydrogenase family protein [Tistrella mobilis]|uniref:3-hydroxybutyryl-CoA dehydrogenase n=1 Tax=Tistrella mobilis (strain KA081020-065) TaxID=1110502 RepID=I3TI79_TISMK|nr:3-hydroxyacyl-CoA dehydrogenase family protein [Tistrella mobilis]AFK52467.1 3-hydroxybutyryl-CoA dehydrogenase [Tistrella mobilis KA081020-065]